MLLRVSLIFIAICWVCAALCAEDVKTYQLGPQDEFIVTVYKHPELSGTYTVPPDGIIDFPRAGRTNVIGRITGDIADELRKKYLEFLLDPQVTVVLTKARIKYASIMGAVAKPAQYPISDTTRIADLIALAGDVVGEQKELTATLKRGVTVIPVDLHAVLSGKKPEANLAIQEGDQLSIIAPTRILVVVTGQVKNPGPMKLREFSTPVDALAQAGDVTARPERLKITLIRGAEKTKLAWGDTTTKLQDGDVIQVENEAVIRITVGGKVKNSGGYDLLEGSGVIEAIALAGGALEDAALSQVTIIRANRPEAESVEHVDLSQAFAKGNVTNNPKLLPGDSVLVPEWNAYVSVFGMVNNVGKIPISETTPFTVVDAISQAGVDSRRAKLSSVVVVRIVDTKPQQININIQKIIKEKKFELNIPLRPGDIVYVPDSGTKLTDIVPLLTSIGALIL